MAQIRCPVQGATLEDQEWQSALTQPIHERRHIKRRVNRVAGLCMSQLEIEDFVSRKSAARAVQPDPGRRMPKIPG
jgi:hypothetical protein